MTVKVKDRGAKRVLREIGNASHKAVKVGVLGGDSYDDTGITVAEVAEIHELGLGVPQRSWLRQWIDENKAAIVKVSTRLQSQVIAGKITQDQALALLGDWAVGSIKARIQGGVAPPNAPSTIARKGSSKPLINFGQFISSITRQVER